jgi:hypothetical protein
MGMLSFLEQAPPPKRPEPDPREAQQTAEDPRETEDAKEPARRKPARSGNSDAHEG